MRHRQWFLLDTWFENIFFHSLDNKYFYLLNTISPVTSIFIMMKSKPSFSSSRVSHSWCQFWEQRGLNPSQEDLLLYFLNLYNFRFHILLRSHLITVLRRCRTKGYYFVSGVQSFSFAEKQTNTQSFLPGIASGLLSRVTSAHVCVHQFLDSLL